MFYTIGMDVGSSAIKAAAMSFDDLGKSETLLGCEIEKIRKRNTKDVINELFDRVLEQQGMRRDGVAYVASTGEGEMVDFRKGHFYSMTCHARGALFLDSSARAVVDIGALHAKVMVVDDRSKVLSYRMTSQCASGSGQFLENIARYLGVATEDIGELSSKADKPEMVSGICAVLAETDVINMVSRGITTANILKGIHLSMARRLINLLRVLKAEGRALITGGLAQDIGMIKAMQELANNDKQRLEIFSHDKSVFAGAIGAALWAGFRHVKIRGGREAMSAGESA
ncbi:MAG: benzoyl-CoA reductase subunit D [Bdellovibrionota bacterium]